MPAKAKQWGKRKAALPALKPHGTVGGLRRTPKHIADPAAGDERYYFEKIVSTRYFEGVQQFLIRWHAYTEADDSWEQIEHLAGEEAGVKDFLDKRRKKNEDYVETLERSVLVFQQQPGVNETIAKTKGLYTYFQWSERAMTKLENEQRHANVRLTKPQHTGYATRWHFTHDSLQ